MDLLIRWLVVRTPTRTAGVRRPGEHLRRASCDTVPDGLFNHE
jgi:hypothetical protein